MEQINSPAKKEATNVAITIPVLDASLDTTLSARIVLRSNLLGRCFGGFFAARMHVATTQKSQLSIEK